MFFQIMGVFWGFFSFSSKLIFSCYQICSQWVSQAEHTKKNSVHSKNTMILLKKQIHELIEYIGKGKRANFIT